MTTISATTILRSRHAHRPDNVLSTLLLRYPRAIHAEFMTHRVFSRNSASSRAIPTEKLIQDVIDNPFIPLHWGKNQRGMQAFEQHDASIRDWMLPLGSGKMDRLNAWTQALHQSVEAARAFSEAGYHKQLVNRLLEPFAHITVVVSSTDWSNFLALRDHPDAEPHIQMLAAAVRACLEDESTIQTLSPGEWHLPFVRGELYELDELIKLSTARCASTSYKTVDGFDMTIEKAIELHDRLVGSTPLHASPTEHVAQADTSIDGLVWHNRHQSGNFRHGWRQYRKMLPNECM